MVKKSPLGIFLFVSEGVVTALLPALFYLLINNNNNNNNNNNYASVAWNSVTSSDACKLERNQRKFLSVIIVFPVT